MGASFIVEVSVPSNPTSIPAKASAWIKGAAASLARRTGETGIGGRRLVFIRRAPGTREAGDQEASVQPM
ncbi:hypothetical protein JI75_06625 [Berryella intestinalis]|uniref:Uncharacterized protein n=1 Tax=Berryella intestinalis TaxID=1531429 RepID=A0A0A8B6B7_9ACTN|nr:hypothetical protein [Berryella intestinalis]AJC12378.1 hypothetical protein JI75_06625 [Berryella intestinalis]